jgi:hypothetical protein
MSTDEVLAGKHLAYELKITNIGRTPGEIFQFEIGWGALNEGHPFSPEYLSSKHAESISGFLGGGEGRVFYAFNSHDIFRGTLREGEKGAIYVRVKYGDTVSGEGQREHTTFVLYHCGDYAQPLHRVNTQTQYT